MYPKLHHPSTFMIVGPSGAGKSVFSCMFLHNLNLFDVPINKIHWYNSEVEALPKKETLPHHLQIEYFNKLPAAFNNSENEPLLIIIDDMMAEASGSMAISDLFTKKSHHQSITALFLTQNFFHKNKYSRDISLNCSYIVLFKTIRGASQVNIIFRQMYPEKWRELQKIYKEVTRKPHSYLFIDLTQNTPDLLRFRTDIFNTFPVCYCQENLLSAENGAIAETVNGKQVYALHFT